MKFNLGNVFIQVLFHPECRECGVQSEKFEKVLIFDEKVKISEHNLGI